MSGGFGPVPLLLLQSLWLYIWLQILRSDQVFALHVWQLCVLQLCDCVEGSGHAVPLFFGLVVVIQFLVFVPPPQVLEQSPQSPQSPLQCTSTGVCLIAPSDASHVPLFFAEVVTSNISVFVPLVVPSSVTTQ